MARSARLHPLRRAAMMGAMLLPFGVAAGPLVDTDELRARLNAEDARFEQNTNRPADVAALRAALGLTGLTPVDEGEPTAQEDAAPTPLPVPMAPQVVSAPVLKPLVVAPVAVAPKAAHTGGLFTLQTAQPQADGASVPTSFGAGGLFAVQSAQPSVVEAPTEIIGGPALIPSAIMPSAAEPTAAPEPLAPLSGAGGLFAAQNALTDAPLMRAHATGGQRALAPLDVTTTNFRLMLATLAQTYSGVNNLSVVTAQGDRGPIALSVKSGTVGLADLKSFSAAHGYPARADGSLILPVVIWPEATLRLTQGDHLALARDTGTFILSMGRMEITDAVIEVTGPKNPHEKVFTPFVTIASGGSLVMEGATVRGLGFGRTVKFAGLTVAGNPLMPTQQDVVIRNTLFEQVRAVTVAGAPHALVEGNTFQDARGNAFNVVGSPHAQIRSNLFRGTAQTNAIRVDVGSDNAVLAENVFLKGSRMAILINGGSNNVVVRDNLIWRRDGGGVKFFNTQCGVAHGNILIDNAQKGIEVRKSNGIMVRDNLMAGGRSAAIWVSAQAKGAQTAVRGNTFERNASGLSAATGAEIWTQGNDFTAQLPKLLDGDIARLTNAISVDLGGDKTLLLSQGQSKAQDALVSLCGGDI